MVLALEGMICYLMEEFGADEQNQQHSFYTEIIEPLIATLEEFEKVKQMMEECIDIKRAQRGDYVINPKFSAELNEINSKV
jgi:hypothetical protein